MTCECWSLASSCVAATRSPCPVRGLGGDFEGLATGRNKGTVVPWWFRNDGKQKRQPISSGQLYIYQYISWYSWVDSNHRPPDPQSGALTN